MILHIYVLDINYTMFLEFAHTETKYHLFSYSFDCFLPHLIPMRWGRKQRQLGYFKLVWYIKIRIFICFFFPKRWIQCNKNDLLVNFHHHLQQAPIWLPQCTLHKGLSIIIQGFISVNWCQLVIYLFLTYNSSQPVVY